MKTFDQLPELIQKRMLQAQVEQGNPEDPEVFRSLVIADSILYHGFNWCDTVEGYAAWNEAINEDNYTRLYRVNPSLDPMTTQSSPDNSISCIEPSHRQYPLTPNECIKPKIGIIPEDVLILKIHQEESISIDSQLINEIISELERLYQLYKHESTLNLLSKLKGTWKSIL